MNNDILIEYLNEHLNRVNEVSEDPASVEKLILKKENNSFGKLVWALIKPTILSQGGKFIPPSFNDIKSLLVSDIKSEIKLMQKHGWDASTEEIAKTILDPTEYDEEVGDYTDTTFLEPYTDLYNGNPSLSILMTHEDNILNFLSKEIGKNYRTLITAIK